MLTALMRLGRRDRHEVPEPGDLQLLGAPASLAPELVDALAAECRSQPSVRTAYAFQSLTGDAPSSELTIGLVLDDPAAAEDVVQSLGRSAEDHIAGGTLLFQLLTPEGAADVEAVVAPFYVR
jgi:SseB protein C-terminal domain